MIELKKQFYEYWEKYWWFKGATVGFIFGFVSLFFIYAILLFPPTMPWAFLVLFLINEYVPENCFGCLFIFLAVVHSILFALIGLIIDGIKHLRKHIT